MQVKPRMFRRVLVLLCLSAVVHGPTQAHGVYDHTPELSVSVRPSTYIITPSVGSSAVVDISVTVRPNWAMRTGVIRYRLGVFWHPSGTKTAAALARPNLIFSTQRQLRVNGTGSLTDLIRWNGTDQSGRPVHDGKYVAYVSAEVLPVRAVGDAGRRFAVGSGQAPLVIDRTGRLARIRERTLPSLAPPGPPTPSDIHQPLDPNFPFRFYYGSTHSHTIWSDGGVPVNNCEGSVQTPHSGAKPSDAFRYGREKGLLDFLAVVEHNHLMNDVCNNCSKQFIIDRYHEGLEAARHATVLGQFVGIYGMEWGVISTGGHLNIYNQEKLISWGSEPAEITVGAAKYTEVYATVANNQGDSGGSFVTFNHPHPKDFEKWKRTPEGDRVVRGLAILSGPADTNSTNFDERGATYEAMYDRALSLGWKVGPEAHQDNHCWNYGTSTSARTVALIPKGTVFNLRSLMAAFQARRFYASEDINAQLAYSTTDGSRVMGESFSSSTPVSVQVLVGDSDGEGVESIELWSGRAGNNQFPGEQPVQIKAASAEQSLSAILTPKPSGQEWYYYVIATQADGDRIWSSPIWIRW
jgi:hypothetical protein